MSLALELFSSRHVELARRFNERLRRGQGDPAYQLPEENFNQQAVPEVSPFLTRQWILVDGDEARGGVMLQEMDCIAGSQVLCAANIQTPITEGAFNRGHAHLGPILLKHISSRFPLLYAVGMGSPDQPFPKLLKALRWHVALSGFYFHAGNGSRFLKELAPLRKPGAIGIAASAAALSGLGGPLLRLAHALSGWPSRNFRRLRSLRPSPLRHWDDWTTTLWNTLQPQMSCAAIRNNTTLPFLYPLKDGPLRAFRLDDADGNPAGWMTLLCTTMQGGHFGNLRVGTIVDALARPGWEASALRTATHMLFELGADLLIVNHTHHAWITALRHNGYFAGPSNYLFAASPPLAQLWKKEDPAGQRVFVTRGDGDGRIHLQ